MKTPALATIFVDNELIGLMGDPNPLVSKIVVASGRSADSVQVRRTKSPGDKHGKELRLDDTIDRTAEPAKPIYLTFIPKSAPLPGARTATTEDTTESPTIPPQLVDLPDRTAPAPRSRTALPPHPDGDDEWKA